MIRLLFISGAVFGLLALSFQAFAQEQIREVEVQVEVPVVKGNRAATVNNAQKAAFEAAIKEILGESVDPLVLAERVNNASSYIKSFKMLNKKEEGGQLIATFRCQVLPSVVPSSDSGQEQIYDDFEERFAIEFVWKRGKPKVPLADLKRNLEKELKVKLGLIKLQRGSSWVELITKASPDRIYRQVIDRYADRADLKLHRDLLGIYGDSPQSPAQPTNDFEF